MTWHTLVNGPHQKADYAIGAVATSLPFWVPSMTDTTNFFVMLTAIGGFVLVCIRLWRQWKHRDEPPGSK